MSAVSIGLPVDAARTQPAIDDRPATLCEHDIVRTRRDDPIVRPRTLGAAGGASLRVAAAGGGRTGAAGARGRPAQQATQA